MDMDDQRELVVRRALYDAAIKGDESSLKKLVHDDPLILNRYGIIDKSTSESSLHIAAKLGHLALVTELLQIKPNMCLARDQDGCNPLHVAVMEGQVHVLEVLLRARPEAAREKTHGGETALHLCVKYYQFEVLKLFLDVVLDDDELFSFKNNEGNTILHLGVRTKQSEMVKLLVKKKGLDKNAINTNGLTAMDICLQIQKSTVQNDHAVMTEIWISLKGAKALDAKSALRVKHTLGKWLDTQNNALMVVASLIATMAFQVGVNPPGGFWQDTTEEHVAGQSIFATTGNKDSKLMYKMMVSSSTLALVGSLSVIILLLTGRRVDPKFVGALMGAMWATISATAISFLLAIVYVSGVSNMNSPIIGLVVTSLFAWLLMLLIGNVRILSKLSNEAGHACNIGCSS